VQSKYNAHTLPEQLLPTKDNDLNLLFWSLARWSVSRMNSFEKHVWRPAVNGDYGPLLSALGAGALGVAAEEKLRELFNSRAPNYWQPRELSSAADKEHLYTALAYINSNNITGALGAIPFMLAQIAHGEKPSSGPVNLAVNASESLQQRLAQFWNAVHTEGANVPKALADTAKAIAEDNLQFVRILTRMNKDKDWNREEALWKRQTGRGGLGSSFGRPLRNSRMPRHKRKPRSCIRRWRPQCNNRRLASLWCSPQCAAKSARGHLESSPGSTSGRARMGCRLMKSCSRTWRRKRLMRRY
jgi:hypothetical protein